MATHDEQSPEQLVKQGSVLLAEMSVDALGDEATMVSCRNWSCDAAIIFVLAAVVM